MKVLPLTYSVTKTGAPNLFKHVGQLQNQ